MRDAESRLGLIHYRGHHVTRTRIERMSRAATVTVGTSTGTSTTLRIDDMVGAVLIMPAIVATSATVQVWGASTDTGTFGLLYGASGAAATITMVPSTASPTAYAVPNAIGGTPFVRFVVGSTAATATATVVAKS
jgi:hypothetical protein